MFLHGPAHRRVRNDYRPAVHDSEGLAILTGRGERIWRPLTNPKLLQVSAFVDKDPKGFACRSGTAHSQALRTSNRTTSAGDGMVEPKGNWGEVTWTHRDSADEEIHDNIVAYWKRLVRSSRASLSRSPTGSTGAR